MPGLNYQVHENPKSCSRNRLGIFGLGSVVVLVATGSLRAAADTFAFMAVLVLPLWVWLGRIAKSIRTTSEGLDIKR